MSSEFPQQAGIDAINRNDNRPEAPETRGFAEEPQLIGTAHELFKSLRIPHTRVRSPIKGMIEHSHLVKERQEWRRWLAATLDEALALD
jgi:hypothetical protein